MGEQCGKMFGGLSAHSQFEKKQLSQSDGRDNGG